MYSKDGKGKTRIPDKLKVFEDYYQDLYKSSMPEGEAIEAFLTNVNMPVLTDDHRQSLEEVITIQEVDWAIGKLKVDKAPGMDGITAEFCKKFRDYLAPHLQELFEFCIKVSKIPGNKQN